MSDVCQSPNFLLQPSCFIRQNFSKKNIIFLQRKKKVFIFFFLNQLIERVNNISET